jgi:GNAT superfamily N-acetyltransferase
MMNIVCAESNDDIAHARALFLEHAASLGFDLCFQDFESELATLPGKYGPPDGRLLLAFDDAEPAGCVALRNLGDGLCEMKRLYVRPTFRGKGIGRVLAVAILDAARQIGYHTMRLDTIATMTEAIALYLSLGFTDIAPYCHNPIPGATFMEWAI